MLLPGASEVSEHTQELVDDEVRRIVEDAERETVALLPASATASTRSTRALLERETLDQPEAYEIAGVDRADGGRPAQATASEPASR